MQLTGLANLWIVSRCESNIEECSAICLISKEQGSSRKFISFGKLKTENGKKRVIIQRKQEIPKIDNVSFGEDINEMVVEFIDNGDNRLFVSVENEESKRKKFFDVSFLDDCIELSNVFIGGWRISSDA